MLLLQFNEFLEKYELGKFLIQTYPLVDFAKHYNVSVDWLCGKTKDSVIK